MQADTARSGVHPWGGTGLLSHSVPTIGIVWGPPWSAQIGQVRAGLDRAARGNLISAGFFFVRLLMIITGKFWAVWSKTWEISVAAAAVVSAHWIAGWFLVVRWDGAQLCGCAGVQRYCWLSYDSTILGQYGLGLWQKRYWEGRGLPWGMSLVRRPSRPVTSSLHCWSAAPAAMVM